MRLKAGDDAIVKTTGKLVHIRAVSPQYVLVANTDSGLQWTYTHDQLEAAPDLSCPI